MVDISRDSDDIDIKAVLEAAFNEYAKACYGNNPLNPTQRSEIRQAFFSGIHWLNTHSSNHHAPEITAALRELVFREGVKGENDE